MKPTKILFTAVLIGTALIGCQDNNNTQTLPPDLVRITYHAINDSDGNCKPEYQAITRKNKDGAPENQLYIIYGETEYFDHTGKMKLNEVPFQVKMYEQIFGLPSDGVLCENLNIKITLEECVYDYPSERSGCPDIEVIGADNFAGIEIIPIN